MQERGCERWIFQSSSSSMPLIGDTSQYLAPPGIAIQFRRFNQL